VETWVSAKSDPHMSALDLGVFAAMLASSTVIGCYFGLCTGRQKNTQDYLMGGRNMSMLPVALSLVASFISGITVQGEPAEIYTHGTQYWSARRQKLKIALIS
jgi:Na+/proline symporter